MDWLTEILIVAVVLGAHHRLPVVRRRAPRPAAPPHRDGRTPHSTRSCCAGSRPRRTSRPRASSTLPRRCSLSAAAQEALAADADDDGGAVRRRERAHPHPRRRARDARGRRRDRRGRRSGRGRGRAAPRRARRGLPPGGARPPVPQRRGAQLPRSCAGAGSSRWFRLAGYTPLPATARLRRHATGRACPDADRLRLTLAGGPVDGGPRPRSEGPPVRAAPPITTRLRPCRCGGPGPRSWPAARPAATPPRPLRRRRARPARPPAPTPSPTEAPAPAQTVGRTPRRCRGRPGGAGKPVLVVKIDNTAQRPAAHRPGEGRRRLRRGGRVRPHAPRGRVLHRACRRWSGRSAARASPTSTSSASTASRRSPTPARRRRCTRCSPRQPCTTSAATRAATATSATATAARRTTSWDSPKLLLERAPKAATSKDIGFVFAYERARRRHGGREGRPRLPGLAGAVRVERQCGRVFDVRLNERPARATEGGTQQATTVVIQYVKQYDSGFGDKLRRPDAQGGDHRHAARAGAARRPGLYNVTLERARPGPTGRPSSGPTARSSRSPPARSGSCW